MKLIRIRPAKAKDVSAIIRLNKEGLTPYRWTYDGGYIRRAVSHGNYYVICRNKMVAGAIKFYLEKNYLWISTMAIFKKYRGHGYAKKLMNFIEKKTKKYGYAKIRLDTLTISRVGKFYQKMGYILIEEGPYYGRKYQIYEKTI